ncbi:uncharacterized protein BDCG_04880 [Blastomyces dermatitidis ER-3]|uniref:Reverse transcriptase zinc-binding domain-containing protein n=1 Tax=Ajellomyces dermatitidis (strain ER-3 / ATCC MYA-2586) TaxID=559297 RepID=A0ABM9YHV3_AJEDR|nr:uncharacterized protein BDCG_04880 [Blastomyces dermatitidis ER-3]EEQ89760.1 hypothetical protein BDCG_04880 [Blastomyces dermatitidis ER-3]
MAEDPSVVYATVGVEQAIRLLKVSTFSENIQVEGSCGPEGTIALGESYLAQWKRDATPYTRLSALPLFRWAQAKIGLRQFLHERKVPDVTDALCECGNGNQTVRHVLLACLRFNRLRIESWEDSDGKRERLDLKEILNTPKLAKIKDQWPDCWSYRCQLRQQKI